MSSETLDYIRQQVSKAQARGEPVSAGMVLDLIAAERADAARPYRMAIARWWVDAWRDGGYSEEQAVKYSSDPMRALRSLITDADIEAARKEAK